KGEYVRTIQYAQEAIQIFEKINDKDGISRSYNTIGLVYYRKKEYDKALLYYEKGLKIDEELHLDKNISIKFTNIGIIHESRKDYNKALLFLFKSLQIGEKIGFIEFTLVTMRHIGEVYLKQQEYSKAILFANKTLLLAKQLGSERELTLAFILLGKIAIQEQRLNVAEQQLLQALFWANKTKEKEHSKEAAENLYILFKKKRQDTKALFYHELVQKYQDSLYSEKKETEIKNLEFSYQLQLKEKEIDLLKKDSLLKEQAQKRNIIMIVSLLTIIVLMTLLAVIFFKGRQKQQKANNLLQVKHKEIIRQQNELLEKTKALEASNHLKNKLFSIIGHDVRSPLNSLRGLLSLVALEGLSAEEVNDLYKNINKQLTSLEAMLANLLQWSKSQMEGERSYLVSVNLQETITEIVSLLQPMADLKAIQMILEVQEESSIKV
ncbi:MAG: tetratricopeptide repeat-containing sensor histidine kinase, partial [Thermoflexibacteraceae bacterium]